MRCIKGFAGDSSEKLPSCGDKAASVNEEAKTC